MPPKKQKKVLVNAEVLTQLSDLKRRAKEFDEMEEKMTVLNREVAQCDDMKKTIRTMESEMHELRIKADEAESSGGAANQKKHQMEEAAKVLRLRIDKQTVQIRRLEKLLKAEKGQVSVHRTKVKKLDGDLKLADRARKTQAGLREGLQLDLETKTEEHKREMIQRLMDLHKIEKERQEMDSIREGHARLVEKLESMSDRATRYGSEANALHVALAASDAITEEYELEVQVQEEVRSDLQLQLGAVKVQDEHHEKQLMEWRMRFHDMKRMYNEVHAHLAVLAKSHSDRAVLDTAPTARFAGHVDESDHLRRDLVDAPHSMGATHSSIVRTVEGTLLAGRQHTDVSALQLPGGELSSSLHATASILTPYTHVGFDSTASRFKIDDLASSSLRGDGATIPPAHAGPVCNRAVRDGLSLISTTAGGRPLAAALADKQLDTFFPVDRHGQSMPLLPSLFGLSAASHAASPSEDSDSSSDGGASEELARRGAAASRKKALNPKAAKRPGALYYGSGLGLKRSGVGLKSAGSAKHILNKILASLPP